MKLLLLIISLFISVQAFGQHEVQCDSLYLSRQNNKNWLARLDTLKKADQWQLITQRYFSVDACVISPSRKSSDLPLLVIDGVPMSVTENLSTESKNQFRALISSDKIETISILTERPPSQIFICKPFTGVVLVTLNEKRFWRRLKKIKFE